MFLGKEFPVVKTNQKKKSKPAKTVMVKWHKKLNYLGLLSRNADVWVCFFCFFFLEIAHNKAQLYIAGITVSTSAFVEKLVNRGESLGSFEKTTMTFSSCGA